VLSAVGLALLAAIQPLGIIAFIALLGSRGGRRNTRAFIVGWMLCAVLVAIVTMAVAGSGVVGSTTSVVSTAGILQIVLGVAVLGFLAVRRRRGPRPVTTKPREERDDVVGPFGAAMLGVMLQGWPIVAAAMADVLHSTDPGARRWLGIAVVTVLSCSTYLTGHVLAGLRPEATAAWLDRLRAWIERHRERVVDVLLLGAGVYLVLHGVVVQVTA
jgi:MFS family permease